MDKLSILLVILAGTSWGTAGLFSNALYGLGLSPFQVSSGRMLFAAVFMLVFLLLYNPKLIRVKPKSLIIYAICGISLLGTSCTYYWAMSLTPFSTAVVLMYTSPIIVTAFSAAFLGEKLTPLKVTGIAGALLYMAGMGFFIGAFPYLIYTFAMRKIPVGVASSMSCVEPMVATIVSILFMNERLTVFRQLILGSVILLSREKEN